ncbi:MAG: hypothetical protein PHW96_04010 [Candidatus Nanoarchaeia archaeon]|nr:hypothetical protein [Candidatus Nanoarchaeia archaeon]
MGGDRIFFVYSIPDITLLNSYFNSDINNVPLYRKILLNFKDYLKLNNNDSCLNESLESIFSKSLPSGTDILMLKNSFLEYCFLSFLSGKSLPDDEGKELEAMIKVFFAYNFTEELKKKLVSEVPLSNGDNKLLEVLGDDVKKKEFMQFLV